MPRKSEQPYLYFDTSRHPAAVPIGSDVTGPFDPPAATRPDRAPMAAARSRVQESERFTPARTLPIQFVNPDKFQIIHCGIDDEWDEDAFEQMSLTA